MLRELFQAQEGKALPYVPQLTNAGGPLIGSGGGYYGSTNPYANAGALSYGRTTTPLAQREAASHLQTYGGGDEAVDWLFSAVNFIANSASGSAYHFADDNGKELVAKKGVSDPPGTKSAPQDLINLFKAPNPYQQWIELLELLIIDLTIVGNAYWVKWRETSEGKPLALYRMHPAGVKIIPASGMDGPGEYRYRVPGTQQDASFSADQVIHFKRPNPHDVLYGMGIVRGGSVAFDTEIALSDTMSSYYQKRGLPSGVVQTERRVPNIVFNKLKQQLRAFYTGPANAGQLMVLEAGLTWKDVSPSAQDALFQTMGGWSRDRVLAMFHINKGLLGVWDGSGDPQLSAWQQLFDTKTMTPLLAKLQGLISQGLTQPGWGLDFVFDYDETQAPDDIIKRATLLAALPGVKVRELREAAGLNPSTGDPKVDDTVLNMPAPQLDANGQGGAADRNLPGEPGRPALPENTQTIAGNNRRAAGTTAAVNGGTSSAQGKALEEAATAWDAIRNLQDFVKSTPRYAWELQLEPTEEEDVVGFNPAVALATMDMHKEVLDLQSAKAVSDTNTRTLARPEADDLYSTRITSIDKLNEQVAKDLAQAATTLERALLDAQEGKAEGDTVYQRVKKSAAWQAFTETVTAIIQSAGEQALSLANIHHASSGDLKASEMNYESLAKESVERADGGAESVVATFKDSLLAKILKLQQKSANNSEYTNTIRESISDWSTNKTPVISLTETTRNYNEGTLQVAEANGVDTVLVSDGDENDEPCIEANGQTWTLAQARDSLIEHPNCRRAFVVVS